MHCTASCLHNRTVVSLDQNRPSQRAQYFLQRSCAICCPACSSSEDGKGKKKNKAQAGSRFTGFSRCFSDVEGGLQKFIGLFGFGSGRNGLVGG